MKIRVMIVSLALALVLSGCSSKTTLKEQGGETLEVTKRQELEYAKKLGDEALAYFLGREYDDAYSEVLYTITPYTQSGIKDDIDLTPEMNGQIDTFFSRVLDLAAKLPKEGEEVQANDWDGMSYDQMSKAYSEGRITLSDEMLDTLKYYGYLMEDLTLPAGAYIPDDGYSDENYIPVKAPEEEGVTVVGVDVDLENLTDEALRSLFFPEGIAPTIDVVSDAFRVWYLDTAKELKLVDSRIFEYSKGNWKIPSSKLDEGTGNKLTLFGKTFELSEGIIANTTHALATSPIYKMSLDTYLHFDTGSYMASYKTDENPEVETSKRIKVTFDYSSANVIEGASELDTYLSGVTGLTVLFTQ